MEAYTGGVKAKTAPQQLPEDMIEGRKAYERFDAAITDLLTVPRATVVKGWKAYLKKVRRNPSRPGPKPKSQN